MESIKGIRRRGKGVKGLKWSGRHKGEGKISRKVLYSNTNYPDIRMI